MALPLELKHHTVFVGTIAIDSDAIIYPLLYTARKIRVAAVYFGANTACAKADTNYNTFAVRTGTTVICSIQNGPVAAPGQTFAAGEMYAGTLVAAAADVAPTTLPACIHLKITKTGNGLAIVGFTVQIDYYDIDA